MPDPENPTQPVPPADAVFALRAEYHSIYLAPHLDDAVLSCGGQIYMQAQAGKTVLVVTVMAGDPPHESRTPFAQLLHDRWQLPGEATAGRRAEDAAACAALGADYWHWPVPDCIYRLDSQTGAAFYASNDDIFGSVHASEAGLVDDLARQLAGLPAHVHLFAPLTIGNHVDHQIVHSAAARLPQQAIAYYEDYPYAAVAGALQKTLEGSKAHWHSEIIPLTEEALQAKIRAISVFQSQVSTFWQDPRDLESMVRQFTEVTGGERIWWPA